MALARGSTGPLWFWSGAAGFPNGQKPASEGDSPVTRSALRRRFCGSYRREIRINASLWSVAEPVSIPELVPAFGL
jgi:hypothetical protein